MEDLHYFLLHLLSLILGTENLSEHLKKDMLVCKCVKLLPSVLLYRLVGDVLKT